MDRIVHAVSKSWTWLSDFHFHRELGACQVVLVVKNPLASAGNLRNMGSIPGSGRPPGGGHGNPLQYSCLENPMDRGAWRATVHRAGHGWSDLAYIHRTRAALFRFWCAYQLPGILIKAEILILCIWWCLRFAFLMSFQALSRQFH